MADRTAPPRLLTRLHQSARLTTSALAIGLVCLATMASRAQVADPAVFINEIHYDNTGTDAGEFVEIAGPAGTDLSVYAIVLYNGAGGASYDTDTLSGTIPDQQNGFGTVSLAYPSNGIQNGSPDGVALVRNGTELIQFLSYEGTFAATNGPASGKTSVDIGVSEAGSEPLGQSLRLTGSGDSYDDFTWAGPGDDTPGQINGGQSFGGARTLSINDVIVAEGNSGIQVATFTVSLSSAAGAGGVSFQIDTADGSATAGSDYNSLSTARTIGEGSTNLTFDVQVIGDMTVEPNETFFVNISQVSGADVTDGTGTGTINNDDAGAPPSSLIVINEVDSDTPGTDAAEFVELYDGGAGNTPLTGLSVVFYNGNNDLSYISFDLNGRSTDANGYFVLGNEAVPGVDLVFAGNFLQNGPDAVALFNIAPFPANAPVTLTGLLDAVVYDTSDADDPELLALLNAGQPQVDENAGGGGATNSIQRCPNGGGGQRNTAGFITLLPTPGAANAPCPTEPPPATRRTIGEIQGTTDTSPFAGTDVITTGVVTGRKSNGFFLQSPDGNPATSDGIFVFTNTTPIVIDGSAPRLVAPGDSLEVTGRIVEFRRSADTRPETLTEISGSPALVLMQSGQPLPGAIDVSAILVPAASRVLQLEPYESMLITAGTLRTVAPTNGFGEFFAVVDGTPRPFREAGITAGHPLPFDAPSPNNIPIFDGNFERIMVEADEQLDANGVRRTPIHVSTGATVAGAFGPLDYAFDEYRIQVDAAAALSATGGIQAAVPAPEAANNQFAIGSANLLNFINPGADRIAKGALMVRNVLRTPAILGAIEVGDAASLQQLGDAVNAAAGTSYQAVLLDADETSANEQNIGFLIDTARVAIVEEPTQLFKGKTFEFAGVTDTLHDRPPLVVKVAVRRPGSSQTFPVTLMLLHLRSLIDVDSAAPFSQGQTVGARVREKRRLGAEDVADAIAERQGENLVVLGDLNAFQFNDGYGDIVGTLRGTPAPADQVVESSVDRWTHELANLVDSLPETQRYTFSFEGSAQVLDHVLVNGQMLSRLNGLHHPRNNADFPAALATDFSRSERFSDHDPVLAIFDLPALASSTTLTSSANPSALGQLVTFTATVSSEGSAVVGGTVEFGEGTTVLATVPVDGIGQAAFTTSTLGSGSHTITARFSGAGYQPSGGSIVQQVSPTVSIDDVAVVEGNGPGTATAVFTVSLGAASTDSVTVTFTTADGTAEAGVDYQSASGTLVIPPAAASATIAIAVVGDLIEEAAETFQVTLSNATNAVVADGQGIGTITNDDTSLAIADTIASEPAEGVAEAAFTVTLSAASGQAVTVNYSTADGSAVAGRDYTSSSGTITFPPGTISQTVAVPLLPDKQHEQSQTFTVTLSAPVNAAVSDGVGVATILDADAPKITSFTPAAGTAGTEVILTGVNFIGVTTVRFNGAVAAFTVLSPTSVRAIVPGMATTGPISLHTPRGWATSGTDFVVP